MCWANSPSGRSWTLKNVRRKLKHVLIHERRLIKVWQKHGQYIVVLCVYAHIYIYMCVHLELLLHESNFHMLRFWVSHVLLKVVIGSSQRPRSWLSQQNWDLGYPASGQSLWFQTSRPVDCARWVTSRFPGSYRYHHWYHCHSFDIDTDLEKKTLYMIHIYICHIYICHVYIYMIVYT